MTQDSSNFRGLYLLDKCCNECLFTKNRLIPKEDADEKVEGILAADSYFLCHKSTDAGKKVVCRIFYDRYWHRVFPLRFATMFKETIIQEVSEEGLKDLPDDPEYAAIRDGEDWDW